MEEEIEEESKEVKLIPVVEDEQIRINRINSVLDGVKYLTDYSKQSRLLTDFTPDVILASKQKKYSHRIQKAFEVDENGALNVERFKAIVAEVKDNEELLFGILPGTLANQERVIEEALSLGLDVLSPGDVLEKIKL